MLLHFIYYDVKIIWSFSFTHRSTCNKQRNYIEQERQLQYTHTAAGIIGVIFIRYRIASAHYAMYYTHTPHTTRGSGAELLNIVITSV